MATGDTPKRVNDKRAEPRHPLRRTNPSRATGGKKKCETRFTAPAYWKFESTSLQRGVSCEPDSSAQSLEKARSQWRAWSGVPVPASRSSALVADREAQVEPDCLLDDRSREAMPAMER
jgi:hypothetical protein